MARRAAELRCRLSGHSPTPALGGSVVCSRCGALLKAAPLAEPAEPKARALRKPRAK